jgi:Fe-S-cluster-containing hydrogenase component 2/CRP-like cAMP-binding protein
MLKLLSSNRDVAQGIDRIFVLRSLQAAFKPDLPIRRMSELVEKVSTRQLKSGERLFNAGEVGESAYLVRLGTIALYREGGTQVISQCYAGELVGQMAVMGAPTRREDAVAVVRSELVEIPRDVFLELAGSSDATVERLKSGLQGALMASTQLSSHPDGGEAIGFLMSEGLGEATNAFVIDESLCIGCDNCERACAETHDGISRLDRAAGPSMAGLHIPVSCRHCEIPHCMKDCPPDAIRRSLNGEVYITDACIGCGNCETNCPYDAIQLRYPAPEKPGLLSWLFFGLGSGPGEADNSAPAEPERPKLAVKCDACGGLDGGPACVRACPTGAALRIDRNDFISLVKAD